MMIQNLPSFFKQRRDKLMSRPESQGAAYILAAAPEVLRNIDVHHPYRQDTNLYYLTGFEEPESFVLLIPTPSQGGQKFKTVFFVRKRDPLMEMWEGARYGTEGALKVFGADEAYLVDEFKTRAPELLKGLEKIYYQRGHSEHQDREVEEVIRKAKTLYGRSGRAMPALHDPQSVIGEMRLFKSEEEITFMRKACSITAQAHKAAMEQIKPGMNEYEVEALIDYGFRRKGAQRVGYGSIVASGVNACCLHYRSNNEQMKEGDLLLIDAGAEYNYYTSDITRTFPVGRAFTKAQATIYDLVLKSQLEAIQMAKPGQTLAAIHEHASKVLIEGMLTLGFLNSKEQGSVDQIWKSLAHKKYYPHGTGHWLGMEVHDVGLYQLNGEPRKLEAGMMFTIEPGFYVQPGDVMSKTEYKDIGIRIEDDVLITQTGVEVMTHEVPKDRKEIEALRAKAFE